MTVTKGQVLTVETVPKYLVDNWTSIVASSSEYEDLKDIILESENDIQEVTAIQGGNVNYAFCITLPNEKTIFLKQVSFGLMFCCC